MRLIGVELFKLRTVRSSWVIAAAAVVLVGSACALSLATTTVNPGADVRSLLSFAGSGGLVILILGIVGSAGDFRHRTIVPELLATPNRVRLATAKVLAYSIVGAVIGTACAAATAVVCLPWLNARHTDLGVSNGRLVGILAGSVGYSVFCAVVGVGIGLLVANQVGAVVTMLVLLFFVDPLFSTLLPAAGSYGPGAVGLSLSGGVASTDGPYGTILTLPAAAMLCVGYALLAVSSGTLALRRRDVV